MINKLKKVFLLLVLSFIVTLPAEASVTIKYDTAKADYYCQQYVPLSRVLGCYVYSPAQIYIREGLSPEVNQETIYHEVGHHLIRNVTLDEYRRVWGMGEDMTTLMEASARAYASYKMGYINPKIPTSVWPFVYRMDQSYRYNF